MQIEQEKITEKTYKISKRTTILLDRDLFLNAEKMVNDNYYNYDPKEKISGPEFHINSGDYFATLATILDLIAQEKKEKIEIDRRHNRTLKRLKNELMLLQENYKIVKK